MRKEAEIEAELLRRNRSSRKLKWWSRRGWRRKFGSWRRKNIRGGDESLTSLAVYFCNWHMFHEYMNNIPC